MMIKILKFDENLISFKNTTIAIIGLGLMGGSIAKSLSRVETKKVYALDRNEASLIKAVADGVIDEGFLSPKEILPLADIVILCLYPNATLAFIHKNIELFKKDALVTDICGVKGLIAEGIEDIKDRIRFVPAHPMAGRELMGYDESINDLFDGCHYIITPLPATRENDILRIATLAKALGAKNVLTCLPKTHDEYIAFTSQLPHVLAVSYMKSARERVLNNFAGGSFRDVSRVALINEVIWTELFTQNKDKLVPEIETLIVELNRMKNMIENDDRKSLLEHMKTARSIKEDYDLGRHDK